MFDCIFLWPDITIFIDNCGTSGLQFCSVTLIVYAQSTHNNED